MFAVGSGVVADWVGIAGGIIGLIVAAALGVAIWRQKAIKQSLQMIVEANEGLRTANADLRTELAAEKVKRADLEGRLAVFVDGLAERIVSAVVEAWNRTHPQPGTVTTTTTMHQETIAP